MRRFITVLALVFAFGLSAWGQGSDDAERCARISDPEQKLLYCSAAIDSGHLSTANLAGAFYNRGYAYHLKGNYDRAIEDYDQAIRLNPGFAVAFYAQGVAHYGKGDYDRAIQDYDQAIRLNPGFPFAFAGRGYAHFYLGQFAAAQPDFAKALELSPGYQDAALWLYLARSRAGQEARGELERNAAQLKLTAWQGQVFSLFLGKITPEAVLSVATNSDAKTDREQHCKAYFYLGEHALIGGMGDEARRLFQQAIDTRVTASIEYAGAQAELRAIGAQSPAQGELKIAVLVPLTGPVPAFGAMARDGARLSIEEWNVKGGVLGKKIVPIIKDSGCVPSLAVSAADKVIDENKVHYLIGEICSKASIPVSEIANAKKVVQISIASTNPAVTVTEDGKAKDYVYRACFMDPFQGTLAAKFALNTLQVKKAFIMVNPTNAYVRGLAEVFETDFTRGGGKIVGKETYVARETDFSAIVAKIAAVKPDIVYLPDYYDVANLAVRQAREKGIKVPFIGGDGWDSSDLDIEATEGSFFTNHYSPHDTRPEVQNFVQTFGATYRDTRGRPKVPDALAALAYDATNLMLTAIRDAGVDDAAKVKDALNKINFKAVTGQLTFDANHNPVKTGVIMVIKGNKVVFDSVVNP